MLVAVAFSRGGDSPSPAPATASAAPTTPAPAAATANAKATGTVTITAVGDVVMGTPEFGLPPAGGSTLFNGVKPC